MTIKLPMGPIDAGYAIAVQGALAPTNLMAFPLAKDGFVDATFGGQAPLASTQLAAARAYDPKTLNGGGASDALLTVDPPPTVTSDFVSIASPDVLPGQSIIFVLTTSQPVDVVNAALTLSNGAAAPFVGVGGTSTLEFSYTVPANAIATANLAVTGYTGSIAAVDSGQALIAPAFATNVRIVQPHYSVAAATSWIAALAAIDVGGASSLPQTDYSIEVTAPFSLTGTSQVTLASDDQLTVSGAALGGAGSIALSGDGLLELANANAFAGGVAIGGGATLELATSASAGSGAIDFVGVGTLESLGSTIGAKNAIGGFGAGDAILFANAAYSAGDTAVVTPLSHGGELVEIKSGANIAAEFTVATDFAAGQFELGIGAALGSNFSPLQVTLNSQPVAVSYFERHKAALDGYLGGFSIEDTTGAIAADCAQISGDANITSIEATGAAEGVMGAKSTLTIHHEFVLTGALGGGALALAAGSSSSFDLGASLATANWSIVGGAVILDEDISYAGAFSASSGAVLEGAHTLSVKGGTLSGLTLEGAAGLDNTGVLKQTNALAIAGGATLTNAVGAIYDITANVGISGAGEGIVNGGRLEKTAGDGRSVIACAIVNSGIVAARAGALDFSGAVSGTGSDEVGAGAALEFDQSVGSHQSLDFLSAGTLDLGDPLGFAGEIENFMKGDTILLAGAAGDWSFAEASGNAGGTLTATLGSGRIALAFAGDYSASEFSFKTKNGETTISYV